MFSPFFKDPSLQDYAVRPDVVALGAVVSVCDKALSCVIKGKGERCEKRLLRGSLFRLQLLGRETPTKSELQHDCKRERARARYRDIER